MKIINCVKVVHSNLVYQDSIDSETYTINPYDLLALKKAIEIKEKFNGSVACISMGAEWIRSSLIRCVAMGADDIYWLCDSKFAGSDTVATSYILSESIKQAGSYDLIICGAESVDGETGQVGIGIAERLKIPCIVSVEEILEYQNNSVVVRTSSNDCNEIIKVKLPALLVFQGFSLVTEKISLLKLKKAQKKQIVKWNCEELKLNQDLCGLKGSKTKVMSSSSDLVKRLGMVINGNSSEEAKMIDTVICNGM